MSNREIKQVIKLDGEQAYSQAIKEAQRNLRTLKSELKAETAELGANATAQQKAETRARSLRQQISEQEKIVAALRSALDEVKQKYGDNADEVARWETRLNNARTSLANMRNELEGAGSGLQNVKTEAAAATVATKSVGDALGELSRVGDSVAGAIEDIFRGMISAVKEAVGELWGMITDTAARANNWNDLASYYGSSAQEIQMWDRSIEAAGGSFQDFMSIVNQVAFGGKEKKITEWLGISKENYQDDVEYALAVLDELERRKETWDRETYDAAMNDIFGTKRSQSVSWFLANAHGHEGPEGNWINGWRDNPERFNGDESAFGMDSETLGTMNDLYIMVANIETKWNALKDNVAGGLGTMVMPLLVNVEGALDGLAEYMNAEDDAGREAALGKIRKNMEEFFTKLGEIIRECIGILREVGEELSKSDDPVTRTIGEILKSLADALQWITEHADEVKTAFETIFGVWLIGKLAAVAGKLASILVQIEAIKAFKGVSIATGAAEASGAAAGASWGTGFGAAILKAVPWLAGIITLVTPADTGSDDIWDAEGNPTGLNGMSMTESEWNAAMERYKSGDETGIWDENGNRTELGEQLGVAATRDEEARKSWIREEAARYRAGGNIAAEWALYGTAGRDVGYAGQYDAIQAYWDKYRAGTATREDWETLNSRFTSQEMQDALISVLKNVYSLDRSEENVPDWAFGLEQRWEEKAQGGEEADRSLMEAAQLLYDTAHDMHGGGSFWENASWLNSELWRNAGQQDGITGADLQGFRSLPGQLQAAARSGVAAGVSGIQVNLDGYRVGSLVAPYVSEMIARDMV